MPAWTSFLRYAVIKNSFSYYLVTPLQGQVLRQGRKFTFFQPVCRSLTNGYYTVRSRLSPSYAGPPSPLTPQLVEETGSRLISWLLISGTFTGGYLKYHFWRKRKREARKHDVFSYVDGTAPLKHN